MKQEASKLISVKKAMVKSSDMTTEMEDYAVIVAHEAFNAFKSGESVTAEFIKETFNKKYG